MVDLIGANPPDQEEEDYFQTLKQKGVGLRPSMAKKSSTKDLKLLKSLNSMTSNAAFSMLNKNQSNIILKRRIVY